MKQLALLYHFGYIFFINTRFFFVSIFVECFSSRKVFFYLYRYSLFALLLSSGSVHLLFSKSFASILHIFFLFTYVHQSTWRVRSMYFLFMLGSLSCCSTMNIAALFARALHDLWTVVLNCFFFNEINAGVYAIFSQWNKSESKITTLDSQNSLNRYLICSATRIIGTRKNKSDESLLKSACTWHK